MINSFVHYVHFGRPKGCFVPAISGMPKTLPKTLMPKILPIRLQYNGEAQENYNTST